MKPRNLGDADSVLLRGRAGTANDPTLSRTQDGTLYGSAVESGTLRLQSNPTTARDDIELVDRTRVPQITGTYSAQVSSSGGSYRVISIEDTLGANSGFQGIVRHAFQDRGTLTFSASPNVLSGLFTLENIANINVVGSGAEAPGFGCVQDELTVSGNAGSGSPSGLNTQYALSHFPLFHAATGTFSLPATTGVIDKPTLSADSGATVDVDIRRAFWVQNPTQQGSGTRLLGENIGLAIDDQTSWTTIVGIRSLVSSGTDKWFIQHSGTAPSLFNGIIYGAGSLGFKAHPTTEDGTIRFDSRVRFFDSVTSLTGNAVLLTVSPHSATLTAGADILQLGGHYGLGGTTNQLLGLRFAPAITVASGALNTVTLFYNLGVYTIFSGQNLASVDDFITQAVYNPRSGGVAGAGASTITAFRDNAIWQHVGAGSSTAGIWTSFLSNPRLETTAAAGTARLPTRRGLWVQDVLRAGAGTENVDANIGIDINSLSTSGPVSNTPLSLRSQGDAVEMRHRGSARFGSVTSGAIGGSILHIDGGLTVKRTTVANANYTALTTDYLIEYTSLSGSAKTVTLPAAATAGEGKVYVVKKGVSSTVNIVIDPNGAELIDGATTFTIGAAFGRATIYCTGTAWMVIGT